MIIIQKSIRELLLFIILIYILMYLVIYNSKILKIENLYILKYIVIIVSLFFSCVRLFRQMKIGVFCYCIVGIALMILLISSIFIFQVEDVFFWDAGKYKNREFFDFAFLLLGCNYLAAIPYFLLILSEIASIRFPPTGASMR